MIQFLGTLYNNIIDTNLLNVSPVNVLIADGAIDRVSPALSIRGLDVLSLPVPAQATPRLTLHLLSNINTHVLLLPDTDLTAESDLLRLVLTDHGDRGQLQSEGGANEDTQLQLPSLAQTSLITSRT